jgi:large subunit ribosomal protein L30
MKKIRITQIKSGIGRPLRQKRTLQALGIGMVAKVNHLVTVEELSVEPEKVVPNELP